MKARALPYQILRILWLPMLLTLLMKGEVCFAQVYGLRFHSRDVVQDKRTGLELSPAKLLSFNREFELSFDYNIYNSNPNIPSLQFGYIFRIIASENKNIDLVISPNPARLLNLIIGGIDSLVNVGPVNNALEGWVNLRIKFLLSDDKVQFFTPDSMYVVDRLGLKRNDSFKIFFGANTYGNYKTSDVPWMSIKDIRISEEGKLKYHWPLDEVEGNRAASRLGEAEASVNNPVWIRRIHSRWEARQNYEIEGHVLLASDDVNERLFLVGDKELLIYSVRQNSIRAVKYLDKKIRVNNNFSSVYNSLDGKIYCFTLNGALVYCLDISTGVWTESDVSSGSAEFFRHFNYYFSPADNSIYTFGGYGQHTYHNDIKRLDLSKNEWQDLTIRNGVFNPRYLAGLGSLNDTVYILGGYGSATGSQMVNPRSYFDLLGYSVKNRSLFRKFEIASIYDDMCVGSTFWVYRNNRDYYALIFEKNKYESALQLIRGSIDSSGVEIVGDKIPYKFFDIRSNASMFFFPGQNKLFACTSFVTDSMKTLLSIYSINFPPAQSSQVTMSSEGGKKGLYVIFAVVLVISAAAASLYFIGRRKGKRISSNEINTAEVPAGKVPENPAIKEPAVTPKYQLVLFGGFQVFSSSYEDITSKFTPLLKELFLLILLYSSRNNKGITSDQISEFLWFGKSESSARNNRAVNIAKLKTILSEMGSVELTKKTGYWKIYFDKENVKSDYSDFLEISGSKSNLNKFKILKLLEITRQGGFLVNLNYEWLDDIKSAVSDKIIETLIAFAEKCNMETDAEFIIHMADSIFNFDKVNEEAMVLKCKAECFLGNHSLAKTTYEKFVREYQKLYDEEFKKSFNEVVKS